MKKTIAEIKKLLADSTPGWVDDNGYRIHGGEDRGLSVTAPRPKR